MDAHQTGTGFVLVVRYGPESDWVRNILAAGTATLRVDGREVPLDGPRLVGLPEARDALADGVDPDKTFSKAEHFLLMDLADG